MTTAKQMQRIEGELPMVSAILVVRNEAGRIREALEQIIGQDYPRYRLEIIVVDGESSDGTAGIASSYANGATSLRVIRLTERGRAQGLNCGIRAARGDVIVRVDARTSIEPDYILRCVETLEGTGADNVGGVQRPIWNSRRQEAFGLAQSHPFGAGDAQFRLGRKSGFVDSVYLGCFRRSVFDRVDLFDTESPVISEDSDMNYRIRNAGGKVYLNIDIKAYYYPRETFADLARLYYRYGGARVGNFLKHGTLTSWRQAVPPMLLLCIVAAAALTLVNRRFAWSLSLIVAPYLVANLAVSTQMAVGKRRVSLIPLMAGAFCCMHFGYAAGFWKRLLMAPKAGTYWGG